MLMKQLACAFPSLPKKYNPISNIIPILEKDPSRTFNGNGSLHSRILEAANPKSNPKVSIFNVLDQWVDQGRRVELQQLRKIIKHLTKLNHFHHALQISQWMGSKSYLHLSSTDFTLRLGLISKFYGVQQADEYFNNIPITFKDLQTYETLLISYADAKLLEKAEGVMQIIRNLSGCKTISYNVMLN
ncbi:Pentatricopeptide repeat-containing protein [Heracleum sosnowskyi]|uniref:Pentatricopeptide repeat-containing protein n=1 Tax=Heracleum sosnowskyi TaxID=360622 RepID=A0AAD8JJ23_9APIA|nr:Pentatricopeptide repeat-containing protein [Heracleum sosnowskyi]